MNRLNETAKDSADAARRPVRILIADDHPVNRLLQLRQLEQMNIEGECACDGVEALAMLHSGRFDVLITDCEMPNMDGFELARTIRTSDSHISRMPIIACTAHALAEIAERCHECGIDDVLVKPVRFDELAAIVGKHQPQLRLDETVVTESAPQQDPETLDERQLGSLTGGDEPIRQQLITSFLRDQYEALEQLEDAIQKGDKESLRSIAHRSKGACQLFGASALGCAYSGLETLLAIQSDDLDEELRNALRQLQVACNRLAAVAGEAA